MSLKEDKNINTIEIYNNKFSKIKKRNFFYNNNINLTAIEPIGNIYEIYHIKKKNKVEYFENKNRSMNKIKKLQNKKNILSNISLNTTSTFNNNNNKNIYSLPFVQSSTNSTFDFKTHTTTNTSFNKTLKKIIFPQTIKKY